MAERRMFSRRILESAKFLTMPPTSQMLYVHLAMNADDDGVAEGFSVMRITGANTDDLNILTSKGFVQVLNEDMVLYVTDWLEHNKIRPDRKCDSVYQELLLQVIPDVHLVESRERADRAKQAKKARDVQRTSNGRHRIGEDSVVEVSNIDLSNDKSCSPDAERETKKETKSALLEQLEQDFETIYRIYPRKQGKQAAFKTYKLYVTKGREVNGRRCHLTNLQIWQAVANYAKEAEQKGTQQEYMPLFSTFMNSRILDYLPEGAVG